MSNALKRLVLGGLVALATALPIQSLAGDTLQRVVDFKTLKVGMSGNQPPMTMVNREGGELYRAWLDDLMKKRYDVEIYSRESGEQS